MVDAKTLSGLRVLVVEDEALITMLIEDFLSDQGCQMIGPCASLKAALEVARSSQFDIALLDIHIEGGKVFPVAELLVTRGVPFLIMSGAGDLEALSDQTRWRTCPKPFEFRLLQQMMLEELQKPRLVASS